MNGIDAYERDSRDILDPSAAWGFNEKSMTQRELPPTQLAPWSWTSSTQNCEKCISVTYKLLCLWPFVIIAPRKRRQPWRMTVDSSVVTCVPHSGHIGGGEAVLCGGRAGWEIFVSSSQFYSKPKTSLKITLKNKNRKPRQYHWPYRETKRWRKPELSSLNSDKTFDKVQHQFVMKTEHRRKRRGLSRVLRNIYLPKRNKNVYWINSSLWSEMEPYK